MVREKWWTSYLVMGLLGLAFGIILIALPKLAWGTLLILFAAWALLYGVVAIIVSLADRGEGWGWHLFVGLCALAIGIIALIHPHTVGLSLAVLIGIFLVLVGIRDALVGIIWARGVTERVLFICGGLAAVCFGIVLVVAPGEGAAAISTLIGIFAAIWGLLTVILAFMVRSVQKSGSGASGGGEPLTPAAA